MFDQIISLENLFGAWREFRRGKRGRQDVQEFERHLENNVFSLHEDLVNEKYSHGSYHRFHIFDPKHRIIHKATVRDRLVHHAVYRVLYPMFDRSFIFDSYSCRTGKGTHAAVDRLEQFTRQVSRNNTRPCWALKFDIRNIYMDAFDHFIKDELQVKQYLRYTDDAVILSKDPAELRWLLPFIEQWLWSERRLTLHPHKVEIRKLTQGIDFLGYVTLPHHRVLRTKTKRRMLKRVNSINIPSYVGLLKHCDGYALKTRRGRRERRAES